MSAPTCHDAFNALLAVAFVFAWQSRRAPSVAMLLLCVLTWRMLPYYTNQAVTGVLLLLGGAAADGAARRTAVNGRELTVYYEAVDTLYRTF